MGQTETSEPSEAAYTVAVLILCFVAITMLAHAKPIIQFLTGSEQPPQLSMNAILFALACVVAGYWMGRMAERRDALAAQSREQPAIRPIERN